MRKFLRDLAVGVVPTSWHESERYDPSEEMPMAMNRVLSGEPIEGLDE